MYWKQPHSIAKVVSCRSSFAILIWRYPKNPSVKEYSSRNPTLSKTSFVNGVGKGSCMQASFNFLKLTQIQTSLVFLSCKTIGLIHSDSSLGSIIHAFNILSSSSLTFSLYFEFNLYGCCLIGFAPILRGIFISPKSPTIHFISDWE